MQLFANNADSKLNGAISDATMSITVQTGEGARFPSPTGGDFFLVTLFDKVGASETNHEIVKCTARAGDVLTVVRAQEGTTARAFADATPIELRVTAGSLAAKQDILVSGTSIKTLNGTSLLGSGNVTALTDAPSDGKTYGRKDAAWVEGGSGISLEVGDVFYTARTLTFPTWLPCDGAAYLQSSYTALFGELGVLANAYVGTKLANPATLPAGNGSGCSWDASGTYLAVAHDAHPYMTVYQRSGSTLTKLADPAALPTGTGRGCSWDASGTYLAVVYSSSPNMAVYRRSGSTLTKLANPATLPAGGYSCSWDTTGTYLAVANGATPFVTVYERSGPTLTKLADPATLPAGIGYGCSWDASGVHLAVAHDTTPFVTVYQNTSYDVTNQFAVPSLVAPAGVDAYIKALP